VKTAEYGEKKIMTTNLEPDFLAQNGDCKSSTEMLAWFRERRAAAEAKGATHHRFSTHPEHKTWQLYEGWRQAPFNDDGILMEGAPRWQLSIFTPTDHGDDK
jgi:hypothetical protein